MPEERDRAFHVTTVVTTYNRPLDTAIAIQSALDQTHSPHDIIVVDDGSKDHTKEFLLDRFGGSIAYHYKENGGVSSARNFGASLASGAYLAFLDSDDQWLPDKLSQQIVRFRARPDLALVLTGFQRRSRSGTILRTSDRRDEFPREGAIFNQVVKHPYLVPSTLMVKKEVFAAVGQFNEGLRTAEDLDLFLRIAMDYNIGFAYAPLTLVLVHESEGLSNLAQTYYDQVRATEDFISRYSTKLSQADRKVALFHAYSVCALGLLWKRDYQNAFFFAAKALRYIHSVESTLFIKNFQVKLAKTLAVDAKNWVHPRSNS